MDYFNAGGGGTSGNGSTDPYAVIPQQFGNGGQPPPQQAVFADYQQDGVATDYETYQQQQQQYRAAQASQQSPSVYFQNQMTAAPGSYFPIHSASDHDFLGPQPTSGATASSGAAGAPYQSRGGSSKDFIMQHQQRRGNQSGQQQSQQSQQNTQQQSNQAGRQQNQQQQQQMQPQTNPSAHFMQQQLQAVAQQQQAQQIHHRLHGAPINPQQFMVPPPAMMQPQQLQHAQQQQVQQMHQMQIHQQQQQMMQQVQQGYNPHQQNQQGHHQNQNTQNHSQLHTPHLPGQHIPPTALIPRLRDWPIRCVIEGKYQSVIIGSHGATIKEIAQSTHCRVEFVNLSKKERAVLGHSDRILTVHGNAEQASKAVSRVLHVIQSEALKDDDNVGVDIVLRLRAHNQLCGRLIGKGGSSIKEIMQKTGTNITVAKYIEPPGGLNGLRPEEILCLMERTIMVRGPSIEAVVQAESLISAKLKRCYESDSHLKAQSMGVPMHPMMMPPAPTGPTGIGMPQFFPTPNGLMQIQHFPPSQHHLHSTNSFLQSGILTMYLGGMNLRQVRMWVPDSMIGALIGTKGKNIKMIIRETGASVKIEAPEEKVQREAEEAEKKQKKVDENEDGERDGAASGDHPHEFLEDNGTVTSADAIEEKPKSVSERMVTINGDDLQLLKAQSFVFSKIAETSTFPSSNAEMERVHQLKIRTEVSVPTKIIGRIIGKGGQNVRELQRITGCVVKIPEEERNGGEVHRHEDGFEEDMTMIRSVGNMFSTHNVQFRLANLVGEYYQNGEHRQNRSNHRGGRPQSAPSSAAGKDGSALEKMDQLGQVPPVSNAPNRNSVKSASPPKSKSP